MTKPKPAVEEPVEAVVSRGVIERRLALYQQKKSTLTSQIANLDGAIALCAELIGLMDKKEAEGGGEEA